MLVYRVVILSRKLEVVLITGRWARYLDYTDVNFSSCWGDGFYRRPRWRIPRLWMHMLRYWRWGHSQGKPLACFLEAVSETHGFCLAVTH